MNILVTGGAGFIGKYLVEKLVLDGYNVTVLDNLSTGKRSNVPEGVELVEEDVRDEKLVQQLAVGKEIIIHLAASVGVKNIMDNPISSMDVNIKGTESVLQAANYSSSQVMLASTSEVYGVNEEVLHERTPSRLGNALRWSYAVSKKIDEMYTLAYKYQYGMEVCIMRFFNCVGPGQSDQYGMVLPRFATQAVAGEPLTVYDKGIQRRSFCDVRDTASAIMALIDNFEFWVNDEEPIFNIGAMEERTIMECAEKIIGAAKSKSPIALVDHPYDISQFQDMVRRVPSTSKIWGATGWSPIVPFDKTISDIVKHAKATRPSLLKRG